MNNRTPTKVLGAITRQEIWTGKRPTIEQYRVFGSCAYKFKEDHRRKNVDPKAQKLMFVGYTRTDRRYRLLHWEKKRMILTAHVKFDEKSS